MSSEGDFLRARGDAAFEEADWRGAADFYSRAVATGQAQLSSVKAGTGVEGGVLALVFALCGRTRALAEMGRERGQLAPNPKILQAAIADARAALSLVQRCCGTADNVVL